MTNFGFPSTARGMNSVTQENGHTATWIAPEILEGADAVTREGDVYAFGVVMTEVCPRSVPHVDDSLDL